MKMMRKWNGKDYHNKDFLIVAKGVSHFNSINLCVFNQLDRLILLGDHDCCNKINIKDNNWYVVKVIVDNGGWKFRLIYDINKKEWLI